MTEHKGCEIWKKKSNSKKTNPFSEVCFSNSLPNLSIYNIWHHYLAKVFSKSASIRFQDLWVSQNRHNESSHWNSKPISAILRNVTIFDISLKQCIAAYSCVNSAVNSKAKSQDSEGPEPLRVPLRVLLDMFFLHTKVTFHYFL